MNTRNDGGFWGNPVVCDSEKSAMDLAAEESAIEDEVLVTGPDGTDLDVHVCIDREGCRWGFASTEDACALRDRLNAKWGAYGKACVVEL